jgi:hypothetical protein
VKPESLFCFVLFVFISGFSNYKQTAEIFPCSSPPRTNMPFKNFIPCPIYKTATMNPAATAARPNSALPAAPL